MRRKLIIVVVLLQLLALGVMAGKREMIRAQGQQIYLRSAPIDPRDPFRGDFVRLSYDLNTVSVAEMRGFIIENKDKKGMQVYAVLKPEQNNVYTLDYVSDQKPAEGLFLKGYTTDSWRFRTSGAMAVKYGIEQYFVQQGKGKELEEKLGTRGGLQVPIEMQVAIGGDGTAVIMGHRWSELGIQLEVIRNGSTQLNNAIVDQTGATQTTGAAPLSPVVKVTLKNVSEKSLLFVNAGDNCAFKLTWVNASNATWQAADQECTKIIIANKDVFELKPNETYAVEIDLNQGRWYVQFDNKAQAIGALANWQQFRLEYHSPNSAQISALSVTQPFWLGKLPTAAFDNRGRVD